MLTYNSRLKQPARTLRANMTDSELLLWSRFRRKQILGVQFYRQKPLGTFIIDFYAPSARLVIEVDGSQHSEAGQAERDAQRTMYLRQQGLQVLRFSNLEVLQAPDAVVEAIFRAVAQGRNPPCPPFSKGGKR